MGRGDEFDTASGGHRLFDTGRKCARCPGRMVVSHHSVFGFLSTYTEECERCGWFAGETPKAFRRRRITTIVVGVGIAVGLFYFLFTQVLPQLLNA